MSLQATLGKLFFVVVIFHEMGNAYANYIRPAIVTSVKAVWRGGRSAIRGLGRASEEIAEGLSDIADDAVTVLDSAAEIVAGTAGEIPVEVILLLKQDPNGPAARQASVLVNLLGELKGKNLYNKVNKQLTDAGIKLPTVTEESSKDLVSGDDFALVMHDTTLKIAGKEKIAEMQKSPFDDIMISVDPNKFKNP